MWRRRPVSSSGSDNTLIHTKSVTQDWQDVSKEPTISYTSLPLSTIPERDSIASHRLSDVPTASSIYTDGSPELGFGFDNPNAPPPLFSNAPDPSLPAPPRTEPSSAPKSSIPVPRKAVASKIIPQPTNVKATVGKTFSERAARAGVSGLSIDIKPRGAWKGASGRIPILEPIRSAPASGVTPKPAPSVERRNTTPLISSTEDPSATNFPQRSGSPDAYALAFVADSFEDDEFKPTVPLKAGNNSPFRVSSPTNLLPAKLPSPTISPVTGSGPNSPTTFVSAPSDELYRAPSHDATGIETAPRRSTDSSQPPPPPPHDKSLHTPVQSSFPTNETSIGRPSTDTGASFEVGDDAQVTPTRTRPPISRFSWTTQATESPPRNYYPSPASSQIDSSPPQRIILRKRPISGVTTSSMVRRKPTPSQITATQFLSSGEYSMSKDLPTSKQLPLSPPELESVDLITALQAQIDDLAHRRRNLGKVIQNLTQLQPQNPVIQDLSARRENARKVALFKAQLAEVQRQEYDLGVRLCRAWKRRDQEAPTTLWIRRVTT